MKHYSNLDTGAPVLTQDNKSFGNFLKKILVDGFGPFPPLGWELHTDFENVTAFKMADGTLLIVIEDAFTIHLRGCVDSEPLDQSVLNDTTRRFFPTIFQKGYGLQISKQDFSPTWTVFGGRNYFYFLMDEVFVFFGQWEDFDRYRNQALICSRAFGNFFETTQDHITAYNIHGMFYPTFIGKKHFFINSSGIDFSKVYLFDSLRSCTLGTLPNLYVAEQGFTFNEEQYITTMGKNMLCKIFNNSNFFFDLNG